MPTEHPISTPPEGGIYRERAEPQPDEVIPAGGKFPQPVLLREGWPCVPPYQPGDVLRLGVRRDSNGYWRGAHGVILFRCSCGQVTAGNYCPLCGGGTDYLDHAPKPWTVTRVLPPEQRDGDWWWLMEVQEQ